MPSEILIQSKGPAAQLQYSIHRVLIGQNFCPALALIRMPLWYLTSREKKRPLKIPPTPGSGFKSLQPLASKKIQFRFNDLLTNAKITFRVNVRIMRM